MEEELPVNIGEVKLSVGSGEVKLPVGEEVEGVRVKRSALSVTYPRTFIRKRVVGVFGECSSSVKTWSTSFLCETMELMSVGSSTCPSSPWASP